MRAISLVRGNELGLLGASILLCLVVLALFPGVFTAYDPLAIDSRSDLLPPSSVHPFGTDDLGRDLFSRVAYGTGISLRAGLQVVVISGGIGSIVGLVAGYRGGFVNQLLMRIADVFIAFPGLIVAMAVVSFLGPSLTNATAAVVVIWWPQYARLMRGQVLAEKSKQYVQAARSIGQSEFGVMTRHVLPNSWVPLVVKGSLDIGLVILLAAGLSFLGLGAAPPSPELGALVTAGKDHLLDAWWYTTLPGLVIFLAVLGFNLVGDALRDAFDPTLRQA